MNPDHAQGAGTSLVSHYGAVQAPPTLYGRALFAELLSNPDEAGGRPVVRRHEHEAVAVAWPEGALRDIDVPDDYEGVRAHLAGPDPRRS